MLTEQHWRFVCAPVAVANFIAETGETDLVTLQAAILHDTVEDTDCSIDEIAGLFGTEVSGVVDECTDEAGVSSFRSKQAQIKTCPNKSRRARTLSPCAMQYRSSRTLTPSLIGTTQTRSNWQTSYTTFCRSKRRSLSVGMLKERSATFSGRRR